jgi:transposase
MVAAAKDQLEDGWFSWVKTQHPEELELVLYDTTSTYFQGLGAEEIGEFGHSKDHRPDRRQIVIGVLMSRKGLPLAHEVFSGNTADVVTFREIIRRVQSRFRLQRVVLVADRGTVSKAILQAIRDCGLEFIVGMRMRRCKAAAALLSRAGRYRPVAKNLKVKDIVLDGTRYILCYNPLRAKQEAMTRQDTLDRLERQLKQGGPRQFVGHRLYRRFLQFDKQAVVGIDRAAVDKESRFDGKFILVTNTELGASEVALAYKDLWRVERGFRCMKSHLDLRPVHHWTEARVRGHVAICFLALILDTLLRRALQSAGVEASMADVMRDLREVRAATVECGGRSYLARTDLQGHAFRVFQALGTRPPARLTPL